jgi:hypothetical protein
LQCNIYVSGLAIQARMTPEKWVPVFGKGSCANKKALG